MTPSRASKSTCSGTTNFVRSSPAVAEFVARFSLPSSAFHVHTSPGTCGPPTVIAITGAFLANESL